MNKDTIYREDVIKEIEECIVKENEAISEYLDDIFKYNSGLLTAIQVVHDLPSADRLQGKWVLECDAEGEDDNLYRCSECGCHYGCQEYDIPNYCPNCGAKMKGADNEIISRRNAKLE